MLFLLFFCTHTEHYVLSTKLPPPVSIHLENHFQNGRKKSDKENHVMPLQYSAGVGLSGKALLMRCLWAGWTLRVQSVSLHIGEAQVNT